MTVADRLSCRGKALQHSSAASSAVTSNWLAAGFPSRGVRYLLQLGLQIIFTSKNPRAHSFDTSLCPLRRRRRAQDSFVRLEYEVLPSTEREASAPPSAHAHRNGCTKSPHHSQPLGALDKCGEQWSLCNRSFGAARRPCFLARTRGRTPPASAPSLEVVPSDWLDLPGTTAWMACMRPPLPLRHGPMSETPLRCNPDVNKPLERLLHERAFLGSAAFLSCRGLAQVPSLVVSFAGPRPIPGRIVCRLFRFPP
jgi:hypothetical protein